jgi:DNA-binding ferritin-like protein
MMDNQINQFLHNQNYQVEKRQTIEEMLRELLNNVKIIIDGLKEIQARINKLDNKGDVDLY